MAAALAQGPEVKRRQLVSAFRTARPAIVSMVAPAGFGKSTLARQFAAELGRAAVECDCAALAHQDDLARRVLAALAEETPQRAHSLAQLMVATGDGSGDQGTRFAPAIAAWSAEATQAIFVFENAESLDGNRAAMGLLTQLLANRPESRAVILCSRVNLRLNFGRFASQRDLMALRADDLRFNRDELRSIFAGVQVDVSVIERALALSQGWPIGAQIVRSLVAEAGGEPALERLSEVRAEDLYDYFSDEILRLYPKRTIDALIACAALPEATAEDVGAALGVGDAETMLDGIVADSPFLSKNAQYSYTVHPLMQATLRARHSGRFTALPAAVANAWLQRKAYVRAAELFCACGDRLSAARALNEIEIRETSAFSASYARTLAALDTSTFASFPRLFASSMNYRQYIASPRTLMAETEAVSNALPADTPLSDRAYVDYFRIEFSDQLGDLEAGRDIAEQLARAARVPRTPTSSFHAHVLLYQGMNSAMLGRLEHSEALLDAAWPLVTDLDQVMGASCISRAALIARPRGHRGEERRLLAEGLERCERAGISCRVGRAHAEAVFGAWLAGEDDEAEREASGLAHSVDVEGVLGFAHFLSCLRGFTEDSPRGLETPAWLAHGHLLACGASADAAAAERHARAALQNADITGLPFLRILARIATAEKAPREAERVTREATVIAGEIDSADLRSSLEAFAGGAPHAGMLEALVARLRRRKTKRSALSVEFTTGIVRHRGRVVELRPRERRLLMLVARTNGLIQSETAARVLWPDADPKSARDALKTTLHRLRRSIGDEELVLTTARGLELRERPDIDLQRIDEAVHLAHGTGELTPDARDQLRQVVSHLQAARPRDLESWDWFEPLDRRLVESLRTLAVRLAFDALASQRYSESLRFAYIAESIDPYDEQPQEIIMRALLGMGDHGAALRSYRDYRALLKNELDAAPPQSFERIVKAASPDRLVGVESS
ncbi:MAG TPA: BTAD domain-containing putative transcriptional regulator [Candidatus Binatus sp.]|nr:BTAD domain-containing putative transcriptional regulator [Candidatus Binatus sp.]